MESFQDTSLANIEAHLVRQLDEGASVKISVNELAEAICARCHEEVRVWVENFARVHHALVEEDPTHTYFVLKL